MEKYLNRQEAGRILAGELRNYANRQDVLVLALPRGGVPVAFEIAKALHAPLDVYIVRKLGVPGHAELAMGAMATGGITVFNDDIIEDLQITPENIQAVMASEQQELNRREKAYRGDQPPLIIKHKTIILVDDGVATGATMRVAIKALKQQQPDNLVVAVPVAAKSTYESMKLLVDKFLCPMQPHHFHAVGAWYENFPQTEDDEVHQLLNQANVFFK